MQLSQKSLFSLQGFPKCISSSVNNVAAHGVPDSRALVEGDILNIDVTVYHKVENKTHELDVYVGSGIIYEFLPGLSW